MFIPPIIADTNIFVACGIILITNDSDFLEVRRSLDIVVMRPSAFVKGRGL